jgi:hypothetical protein
MLAMLAACNGQTLVEPGDAGPSDARADTVARGASDATPETDDSGLAYTGPSDATPVQAQLDASLPSDCVSICEAKATSCGAPSGAGPTDCAAMCAASPTPAQLTCIQSSSCNSLAAAFEDAGTVCGIGHDEGG